jgi:hypothetical protein
VHFSLFIILCRIWVSQSSVSIVGNAQLSVRLHFVGGIVGKHGTDVLKIWTRDTETVFS